MAKKLVLGYSIDTINNAVIIPGNIFPEKLQLITDVDSGSILFNFADPNKGFTSVSFNEETELTTIILEENISSIANTTNLQIFVDEDNVIDFNDELLDPVNKIRVSEPENLIDTDFEYGLQSTKWETLELSGNIPSFYASGYDGGLRGLNRIVAIDNSRLISVYFDEPHNLTQGSPILVQGLTSKTAEGKYLVKSILSETSFTYIANKIQNVSGNIHGPYTTVDQGQFYVGSQVSFDTQAGLVTDEAANSNITVTTPEAHGFKEGSNFYFINTIAPKKLRVTANTANAPDGRPYIDDLNTINTSYAANTTMTETKNLRGSYYKKIIAENVDTSNDRILWDGHALKDWDCVLYVPSNGDAHIGGLDRLQVYYVRDVVAGTSFKLANSWNGAAIDLTSTGTYNYGRGQFMLAYEIAYMYYPRYTYQPRYYTFAQYHNIARSGWDLKDATYYDASNGGYVGLMGQRPDYMVFVRRNDITTATPHTQIMYQQWHSNYNVNQQLGYNTSYNADSWNFVEDVTRWSGLQSWNKTYRTNDNFLQAYFDKYYGGSGYSSANRSYGPTGSTASSGWYMIPLMEDEERDSFYLDEGGIADGLALTLTTTTAPSPTRSNWTATTNYSTNYNNTTLTIGNGTWTAEQVTENRFRLKDTSGNAMRLWQANGAYSFAANFLNTTRNSFYLPEHGLTSSDVATIAVENSGVLPSTLSGAIVLDAENNMDTAAKILENSMQAWLDTKTDAKDIKLDGSSYAYPIGYGDDTAQGRYVWSSNGVRFYNGYVSGLNKSAIGFNTTYKNWATGLVEDILYGNTSSGWDQVPIKVKTNTAWVQNKTVPFYSWTIAPPQGSYLDFRAYTYHYSRIGTSYYNIGRTNLSSDWYYQGNYTIHNNSNSYNKAVILKMRFWKEDWNTTFTNSWYLSASNPLQVYGSGSDWIEFNSVFQLYGTTDTLTNTDVNALIASLAADFRDNFVYPSLNNGDNVYFSVVNDNRVRLLTASGLEYDFTDNGTPDVTFTLQGGAGFGTLDGGYSVKSVPTDNTFIIEMPFEAAKKTISINANTSVSNSFAAIYNEFGHNLQTGTPLLYKTSIGSPSITNLANNNTYYAFVLDDKYFQLASNASNAIAGETIAIESIDGYTHTLETSTINGLVPAQGNAAITTGSNKVTGAGTQFKRYYKTGDEFIVIDNTSAPDPGSIEKYTIAAVTDDVEMYLTQGASFTSNSTHYMIPTSIYTRPDGSFQHRPFDGGVEITAGTAPDSQIIRQTRKYFRYQSGKGIQVSLAINFNPPRPFESLTSSGTTVTGKTAYPHGVTTANSIRVTESNDSKYNGIYPVVSVPDEFTMIYTANSIPSSSVSGGFPQYSVDSWVNSKVRAGLFDEQNGMFFEYDGQYLYAVRRSSTQQLSGTVSVRNRSSVISGSSTNFSGQLTAGDKIVIRGMSYKVVKVNSNSKLAIQPEYRGADSDNVIVTKTIDTKVPQHQWNEDVCDGTGRTGFNLDINKIQMAYIDYSWYGAGKIRFGFKTRHGRVNYVHSFLHNNRLTEAYMRSGNIPARYEIQNTGATEYIPSLFHWGTSVIMDGRFDDDKAYLFTASSDTLNFTNGESRQATTTADSVLRYVWNRNKRTYDFYVDLYFATTDASKFSIGTQLYSNTGELNGEKIHSAFYSGSSYIVRLYVGEGFYVPSNYPVVGSGVVVDIGASAATGISEQDILSKNIPLISIRLAPSVDNNITGNLGERDIINRMQLQLKQAGLVITHDCTVNLILNGSLNNTNYENVNSPSLSNLVRHNPGDEVVGGTTIFSFRASGGQFDSTGKRSSSTSDFDLSQIIDLGNCILGGDGVFPNGPDLLTLAVKPIDTSDISAVSPFQCSARITWTESQA